MNFLAAILILGCVASQAMSAPAPNMSPAMHTVLMDMLQKMMGQGVATQGISPAMNTLMDMIQKMMAQGPSPIKMKPHLPHLPTPPMKPLPPVMPQYMPPARQPPPQPMPPPSGNNDVFMNMPTGGAGAMGGYPMSMNSVYCPPGPTSSDSCKDIKLIQALYYPDNTPRYNWVPPMPYDGSVPDSVKDTAQNILMMKVNSRPNRMIYPKEQELLSILGDIPGYHHMGYNLRG